MTYLARKAGAVVLLGWAVGLAPSSFNLISPAEAVIGRPATPVSYAGVARRTTTRAVAYTGAAYGAAYATPTVVVAPPPAGCVRVVDAYTGAVTYRCP